DWTSSNTDWLDGPNTALEKDRPTMTKVLANLEFVLAWTLRNRQSTSDQKYIGRAILFRRRSRCSRLKLQVVSNNAEPKTKTLMKFTYTELRSATRNFRQDRVIGEGGFVDVKQKFIKDKVCREKVFVVNEAFDIENSRESSFQVKGIHVDQTKCLDHPARLCCCSSNVKSRAGLPYNVSNKTTPNAYTSDFLIIGTFGYLDAEFFLTHRLTHKSDVYAFGVVLLEVLCGRTALDFTLDEEQYRLAGCAKYCIREEGAEPLPWHTRIKIAIGVAQGLAFLLSLENTVICRYMKSSNILLDVDYNAKLSDFRLAKLGPHNGESHVTTRVASTYGFMAPKYITTGHIYIKSDVYAFGMVMLEIITRLRAMVTKRYGQDQNLLYWGRPFLVGTSGSLFVLFPFFFAALSLAGTDGAG
nr:probable serine/threonine-protein kinase NAK isoform X1 [Tanacetum cinerariifolium]